MLKLILYGGNKMRDNLNLGSKYKQIRQSKGINIYDASKDIISKTQLSRWENDQVSIKIDVLLKLLRRVNVQLDEFLGEEKISPFSISLEEVTNLYAQNDTKGLKELTNYFYHNYLQEPTNKQNLYTAAMVANFYMDLTGINLLNAKDCALVWLRLVKVEHWYREDIIFFGNTQLLLTPEQIYELTRSLISDNFEHGEKLNRLVSLGISNAIFILLKKKRPDLAGRLLKIVGRQKIDDSYTNEKIHLLFMKYCYEYTVDRDASKIEQLLHNLESLSLPQLVNDLTFAFRQIQAIYSD